jgi:hypothetical protein
MKIVGVQFRPKEAVELLKAQKIGNTVFLKRETDNAYDKNAIKVLVPNLETDRLVHVGYVAREEAQLLCEKWESGRLGYGQLNEKRAFVFQGYIALADIRRLLLQNQ